MRIGIVFRRADDDGEMTPQIEQYAHDCKYHLYQKTSRKSDDISELWRVIRGLDHGDAMIVGKASTVTQNETVFHLINAIIERRGAKLIWMKWDLPWSAEPSEEQQKVLNAVFFFGLRHPLALRRIRKKSAEKRESRPGRYAPYGWMIDPYNPKRLIPDESETEAVKAILQMRGVSIYEITKRMNAGTFRKNCRGKKWLNLTVKRILKREARFNPGE